MKNGDLVSRNLMEELVDMNLSSLIISSGVCDCAQCKADIRALALNNLPPCYVVSLKGDIFSHVSAHTMQSQADITTAIMNAINIVKKAPRHKQA